jgi:CheY-like chemotaxis protein
MLTSWGYEATICVNGTEAWDALQEQNPPSLVLLDWMMPDMDGVQVCQNVRALPLAPPTYVILLTAKGHSADIVTGLEAGADDYITKPFHPEELRARLQVGCRVLGLQHSLAKRVRELEHALTQVKQLSGLLPICAYCKKIRDDGNYWQQVECYLAEHSEAEFTHSICPECYEDVIQPQIADLKRQQDNRAAG